MAAVTWSDGADFGAVLSSGTPYSIDCLTVPPGFATGANPQLLISLSMVIDERAADSRFPAVNTSQAYFVDTNAVEWPLQRAPMPYISVQVGSGFVFDIAYKEATQSFTDRDVLVGIPAATLNLGGLIRLRGTYTSSTADPLLTGTLVSMILTVPSTSTLDIKQDWQTITLPDNSVRSRSATSEFFFLDPTKTGLASPLRFLNPVGMQMLAITTEFAGLSRTIPATPPTFSPAGDPNWVDVITRVNRDCSVGLGLYVGLLATPPVWAWDAGLNYTMSFAYNQWVGGAPLLRGRSYGQVVS